MLATFGQVLQQVVRTPELVGRYGGEEFCVLMPISALDSAVSVGQRIRAAIHASAPLRDVGVTFSAGAPEMRPIDTLGDLLKRADIALYEAKDRGRNRLVLAPADPSTGGPADMAGPAHSNLSSTAPELALDALNANFASTPRV